jgi:hypothetical protein
MEWASPANGSTFCACGMVREIFVLHALLSCAYPFPFGVPCLLACSLSFLRLRFCDRGSVCLSLSAGGSLVLLLLCCERYCRALDSAAEDLVLVAMRAGLWQIKASCTKNEERGSKDGVVGWEKGGRRRERAEGGPINSRSARKLWFRRVDGESRREKGWRRGWEEQEKERRNGEQQ